MTERITYHAVAVRDGNWYAIAVHGLPPHLIGVTQARGLEEGESMTRECIALLLDVDKDSFDVILAEGCASCCNPFDPTDTRFDGRARYRDNKPWCRACVDRCHDNEIADHRCAVCR